MAYIHVEGAKRLIQNIHSDKTQDLYTQGS